MNHLGIARLTRPAKAATLFVFVGVSTVAWAGTSEYFDSLNLHPAPRYVQINEWSFTFVDLTIRVDRGVFDVSVGRLLRPPAGMVIPNFSGSGSAEFSVNGGPFTGHNFNLLGTSLIQFNHNTSGTDFYDTEMLQMNLSGGNLPAGMLLRESPTLASRGGDTSRPVTGGFMCESFFDVFTELSLDGGQTWAPSSSSARIQGTPEPGTLLALGIGALAFLRRRRK